MIVTTVGSHPQLKSSAAGRGFRISKDNEGYFLNQNIVLLKSKDEDKLDQCYLAYLGKSPNFTHFIQQTGRGAANQMRIPIRGIKKFKIPLPPLPTQKRIASILSAYDDLIENNLKRIQLLEEAAQHIYKEWFVHFRYPGHEEVPIDEESGLPEGWEMKKTLDIMDISGGGTPSTKNPAYWENGNLKWFSPTDLSKSSSLILTDSAKKITTEGLNNSSAKLLPPKTILMSSRATIGLFGLIDHECSTNQGFINIIPKEEYLRYYILFNLMNRKNEIIAKASGATFKEISKRTFKDLDFPLPPQATCTSFQNICQPLLSKVKNLVEQNLALKEARDILLPRLMNRTIRVD